MRLAPVWMDSRSPQALSRGCGFSEGRINRYRGGSRLSGVARRLAQAACAGHCADARFLELLRGGDGAASGTADVPAGAGVVAARRFPVLHQPVYGGTE